MTELDLEIEQILAKMETLGDKVKVGKILQATATYRHRRAALALETLKAHLDVEDLNLDATVVLSDS